MQNIEKNIRTLRKQQGLKQEELAEKLFVTRQTVSNYENGRTMPDLDMLVKLAEVFATDVNTLIYGPPIPEARLRERKRMLISTILLVLLAAASAVLRRYFAALAAKTFRIEPQIFLSLLLDPALMLFLGWWAMQAVCLVLKAKPPTAPWVFWTRRGLAALLLLNVLLILPFIIWLAAALNQALTQDSISMFFPRIPVYTRLLTLTVRVAYDYPGVYVFFGVLLRLLGFPKERQSP